MDLFSRAASRKACRVAPCSSGLTLGSLTFPGRRRRPAGLRSAPPHAVGAKRISQLRAFLVPGAHVKPDQRPDQRRARDPSPVLEAEPLGEPVKALHEIG